MTDLIEQLRDAAYDYTQNKLLDAPGIPPFVMCQTKNYGKVLMDVPFESAAHKIRLLNVVRLAFALWEVSDYVFASETWLVVRKMGPNGEAPNVPKGPLENEPDKKECFTFLGVTRTETFHGLSDIARFGGEVTISKPVWRKADQMGGDMVDLLPPLELPPPPQGILDAMIKMIPDLDPKNHKQGD